jgi:cytochrome c oxidase assembly protein subunit 15
MKANKPFLLWLGGTCFLIWIMIVLGGATRLTHSGLSIVEWKPITGIIPPLNHADWQQAFHLYQQFPEYQQVNQHITLQEFKFIFWMEYAHRLLGRFIGIFFLIPLIWFWRQLSSHFRKKSLFILGLGLLQGIVGWYMVKSGLYKDPVVSPYRLTLHLGLAFVLYGVVFWMLLEILERPTFSKGSLSIPIFTVFLLQIFTMLYGGLVAGHKSGLIYNTFPLMEGQWFPNEGFFYQPVWINFFNNAALVQWCHRFLAVLSWLGVLSVFIYEYKMGMSSYFTRLWLIVSTIQVVLGIITLLYQAPVFAGVLHQGWAVVVLTIGLRVLHSRKALLDFKT